MLLDEPCEGLAPIIVEQHPQAILATSDTAADLDPGTVVYSGAASSRQEQPDLPDLPSKLLRLAR